VASVLHRLRIDHPNEYGAIVDLMRIIAPWFWDFSFEVRAFKVMLAWLERGSDEIFFAYQASDGFLRSVALITLLCMPNYMKPGVVILDEPELGLHPDAITYLVGKIHEAAETSQIILATQSPELLRHFEAHQIVVVERKGRETILTRPNPEHIQPWLDGEDISEPTMADLWRRNVIGGLP